MDNRYGLFLGCLVAVAVLVACQPSNRTNIPSEYTDVVVQGSKTEEENAFCKDFSLDAQQVQAFLDKSKFIDAKAMHDKYDHLPCYVYGTLRYKNNNCSWEIRAGGTGLIQCPQQEYIIACDECDDLLKD